MRSVYNWPKYQEYCNHDVSYFVGGRASAQNAARRVTSLRGGGRVLPGSLAQSVRVPDGVETRLSPGKGEPNGLWG